MTYTKQLPTGSEIIELAKNIEEFPILSQRLLYLARRKGTSRRLINLLKLFPPYLEFDSRAMLVNLCEDLRILIEQERYSPFEFVMNPQG
jgi:hypothetical protein